MRPMGSKIEQLATISLMFIAVLCGCAHKLPASDLQTLDWAAEGMAQQISKSDEQSLSVLLAALQTAGFSIVDEKGTVLRRPPGDSTGQGLGFYDFEAEGSLKLDSLGISISLEHLAGTITKETPQISALQFAELLMTDLRTQADNSNNVNLRFWARLIIELGKYSAQPVDLMTASASHITLTVLQTSLLNKRLQGDIYTLEARLKRTAMIHPPVFQRHLIVPALWEMNDVPLVHLASDSSIGSLPCSLSGDEALILDGAANILSFGNGRLMELLEHLDIAGMGNTLGKLSSGLNKVNAVLSWGKLVAAVTMLKGEITVNNPPLIRTLNSVPGEKRLITAKIWSEVGKKQLLNCSRTALNIATGLDFNLPSEGPVADTVVGWDFASDKEAKFVRFESPPGKDRNPLRQVTDNNGISQMWLVGASKIPAVVYQKNPKKVTKTATVLLSVTLKSSKDFIQNWIDIGGVALGGLAGIPGSIAEIGFRLPYITARAIIPVIDHEPFYGYRAITNVGYGHYHSGVICSLEMPFTITASTAMGQLTYNFVPSSPTAGKWHHLGQPGARGSYTVEEVVYPPKILTVSDGGLMGYVDLAPLETDECAVP